VELDLFEEMRAFAALNSSVSLQTILQMATLNAARALGLRGQVGEFAPKAFADLIAIPFGGKPSGVYDAILTHNGPITASMIDGRWAIPPHAD